MVRRFHLPTVRSPIFVGAARWLMVLIGSVVLVGVSAAPATATDEDPPPRFEGVLQSGDEPIADAVLEIREIDGEFTASVTTGPDGAWAVDLPARGATYEVELMLESLPAGVAPADAESAVLTPRISQPGQVRQVAFDLGADADTGVGAGGRVGQALLNGVKFGLIIAMASIGLSLVFATTGLINFAHGELVTFGAALAWWLNTRTLEATLIVATVLAVVGGAALGLGVETGIMRPLRRRKLGPFQFVVVTIGLSLVGRQLLQIWIGEGNVGYRQYRIQTPWQFGPVEITPRDLAIIVVSVLVLVAVASTLQLTRMGKAMRAVSDNADLAASSGIAVDGVVVRVWAAGAGLAALGGVMFGLSEVIKFDMGFRLLLLIFASVVLGGLGTAYGAMAGGLVIGIVTEVSTVWIPPELKFVWALLALVVVLLFRPQGILGVSERVG